MASSVTQLVPPQPNATSPSLKEQGAAIDRLSKENFDLKMKIHFLEQALNKHSEDDIKEILSENVELKSSNIKLEKEVKALRSSQPDQEEITYLKERIESYEVEVERLRTIAEENESRPASGVPSSSSGTLVEIDDLKHENAELRRDLGVQTSMLTSRNKEKDRLYLEIEELKLALRRNGRNGSMLSESRWDRSPSRTFGAPPSRASNAPRSRGSDIGVGSTYSNTGRDYLETKNAELRDQLAAQRAECQDLGRQLKEAWENFEALDKEYGLEFEKLDQNLQAVNQELQAARSERDEILKLYDEKAADFKRLQDEAQNGFNLLEGDIEEAYAEQERLRESIQDRDDNYNSLQKEMKTLSEELVVLEDNAEANRKRIGDLEQEREYANREIETLENNLSESSNQIERLNVQLESSQNEISFLREEQDSDKIKIGDLETSLRTTEITLQGEKEKADDLEKRIADERDQRELISGREKQEVQKVMNDLNREASGAQDEARRLRQSLASREEELSTWKSRLEELETGLREALGHEDNRSGLLNSVLKLQEDMDTNSRELELTRSRLDEKEQILRHRDSLLENQGLEHRRLTEEITRERNARKADKQSFEQSLKAHQQASRSISQNNSKISELETLRDRDRKKLSQLEASLKGQLTERNDLLLSLWKRLSAICGGDWAHSHSLINGNLPSMEVIGNILFWPGFSKNLILAVRTVESITEGFRTRIDETEKQLKARYETFQHELDNRTERIEYLEEYAQGVRTPTNEHPHPELAKLESENRLLRAELSLYHKKERSPSRDSSRTNSFDVRTARASLMRHHSSSAVERLEGRRASQPAPINHAPIQQPPHEPGQEKWLHRLRELEKRLKAEREARLLDRTAARKRLAEGRQENEELRLELQREKLLSSGRVSGRNSRQVE